MDQRRWFQASLIVSGDSLRPDEIGVLLGLDPTRTHVRGEPRGRGAGIVWDRSVWSLESPLPDDADPAEHLNWLLSRLEPKASVIKDLSGQFHVKLFCGFSSESGQGGFTLDGVMLGRIASLGVPLTLDLYPPPPVP